MMVSFWDIVQALVSRWLIVLHVPGVPGSGNSFSVNEHILWRSNNAIMQMKLI